MNKREIIILLAIIVPFLAIFWFYNQGKGQNLVTEENPPISGKASMIAYSSQAYGISFEYPSNNFLLERQADAGTNLVHTIIIGDEKDGARNYFEGKVTTYSEAPPTIMVDIYKNEERLDAKEWMRASTNWTIKDEEITETTVAGEKAYTYSFDGLYAGRTVLVASGGYVYSLSVGWITSEDQLVKDFDMLLNSIVFTK